MCYNCGCGMSDDDMGQGHALVDPEGKSLTDHTFEHLANDWKMSPPQTKELVYGLLTGRSHDIEKQHQMEHLYEIGGKSQGMSVEQAKQETLKLLQKVLKK